MFQSYVDGPGHPDGGGHPPTNYHAYAAATGGAFHRSMETLEQHPGPVLILLRGNLRESLATVREVKSRGRVVGVTFKEAGRNQICALLTQARQCDRLFEVMREAAFAIAPTPDLAEIYRSLFSLTGEGRAAFIPTPYPLEYPEWRITLPAEEKKGVFIGTRQFGKPDRNHLHAIILAVEAARRARTRVTLMETAGGWERRLLRGLRTRFAELEVVQGPLSYADWLKLLGRHRVVFQLDESSVPGQVAGDAIMAGTPCVGGNGTVERLVFPDWNGHHGPLEAQKGALENLLANDDLYQQAVVQMEERSLATIGFEAVRSQLAGFLGGLKR